MSRFARALAAFPICLGVAGAALAQEVQVAQLLRPPASIPGGAPEYDVTPAQAQDAAGLMVRIDRLESQLRTQNGQIEEMQFQMKRLEDQLRKFQEDVDFRFQENSGTKPAARPAIAPAPAPAPPPGRRTDLNENGYPVVAQSGVPAAAPLDAPARVAGPAGPARRGASDAFDPDSDPGAPGAPRPLGETPSPSVPPRSQRIPAGPVAADPINDGLDDQAGAPMDLHGGGAAPAGRQLGPPIAPATVVAGVPSGPARVIGGGDPAETPLAPPVSTPRSEFNAALATLRAGQYDAAEQAFLEFLQKRPKDRLAVDAQFYLGESYYKASRPREAAEQYLKISTDFEKSPRAPEALLKLGMSLEKLGAREQACAAYEGVGRKYPTAAASIRASAERESKRAQC